MDAVDDAIRNSDESGVSVGEILFGVIGCDVVGVLSWNGSVVRGISASDGRGESVVRGISASDGSG